MPGTRDLRVFVDFTPLTPTAPMHWPSAMMGTAFEQAAGPGALRNETRPWLIISS